MGPSTLLLLQEYSSAFDAETLSSLLPEPSKSASRKGYDSAEEGIILLGGYNSKKSIR